MKRIIILSGVVLLTANLLFGFILSSFDSFNVCVSSFVIVATTALLFITDTIRLKDGYKVSLLCLFSVFGIMEYISSLFAPNQFKDNWWLIAVIALIALELILLLITNAVSKKIE